MSSLILFALVFAVIIVVFATEIFLAKKDWRLGLILPLIVLIASIVITIHALWLFGALCIALIITVFLNKKIK